MRKLVFSLILVVSFFANAYSAEPLGKVWFTEPKDGAKVKNPIKVCFSEKGLKVVEWSKNIKDGEGHHHLLVDAPFPTEVDYLKTRGPLKMVHYKKQCTTIRKPLPKGKHVLRGMFTHNNHKPYFPVIGATINIEVVE